MRTSLSLSLLSCLGQTVHANAESKSTVRSQTAVSQAPPPGAARPVAPDYVSFSIEFSSFPSYAGTAARPNLLTRALLANIAQAQGGAAPVIRVGGASQDRALLTGYMDTAFNYSYVPRGDDDYLPYGRAFYESYLAFPPGSNTKFIHGLNLAKSAGSYARNLRSAVVMACEEFRDAGVRVPIAWELGHEPDMYGSLTTIDTSGRRQVVRSGQSWNEDAYVRDWLTVQRELHSGLAYSCPEMTAGSAWRMIGPSFSGRDGGMDAIKAWEGGLRQERVINEFSSHFYAVDGRSAQNVTAQQAISNHAQLKAMFQSQAQIARYMSNSGVPFILGEVNFARGSGARGMDNNNLSDTFAAALWTLNMALYAAANGVSRLQLHQTIDAPGAAWQPLDTHSARREVKPTYYGALAAATMVARAARIVELDTANAERPIVAYAAYEGDRLRRIMLINLASQQVEHSFVVPQTECAASALVSRLAGPATTATSYVSWAGLQFGADDGLPHLLKGAGQERMQRDQNGAFKITMSGAGAVMLDLVC